jgi:hypothetical protein
LTSSAGSGKRTIGYTKGSILPASAERRPRRICVIGNSSVGAVRMALGDRGEAGEYGFAFFASGGSNFERISIDGDFIAGFQVDSGGERDLKLYDAFVMHGQLPAPHNAYAFAQSLTPARYSLAVRSASLLDWRERHKGWAMALALHQRYGRPVLSIPRNVFASECVGAKAQRDEAHAGFSALIAPLRLVALPDALFDDDGRVFRKFFAGYVNVHGRQGPAARVDEWHYNREAGGLILDALTDALDAALA